MRFYFFETEGTSVGEVHWKFELKTAQKAIDAISVVFRRQTFENGHVAVELCGDNKTIPLTSR